MSHRILGLDGVRGLSVIAVVLTHLHTYRWLTENGYLSRSVVVAIDGLAGVSAFFVLSGFLITYLLVGEQQRSGSIDVRQFFIRRALRIVPIYTLFLIAAAVLAVSLKTSITGTSLFYAALYAYNFIPRADYSSIMGHTWSLAVEWHFYLVWPFLFYRLRKHTGWLCIAMVAAIAISGWFLAVLPADQNLNEAYFVNRWTIISGGNIAIGCLGALLLTKGHRRWRTILGGTVTPVVGLALWFSSLFPLLPHEHLRPIGIGLIVCWLFINQGSLITGVLEFRPLRYIGMISYGVYMYQGLFLATGPNKWFPDQQWPLPWWAGLALLCIVAPLSYRYIEKPILRWKSRLSSRPTSDLIHSAPHPPGGPRRHIAQSAA